MFDRSRAPSSINDCRTNGFVIFIVICARIYNIIIITYVCVCACACVRVGQRAAIGRRARATEKRRRCEKAERVHWPSFASSVAVSKEHEVMNLPPPPPIVYTCDGWRARALLARRVLSRLCYSLSRRVSCGGGVRINITITIIILYKNRCSALVVIVYIIIIIIPIAAAVALL